jgi:hypothetical protein
MKYRCDWENDKLLYYMMVTLQEIHQTQRINPSRSILEKLGVRDSNGDLDEGLLDEVFEKVKVGDDVNNLVTYDQNNKSWYTILKRGVFDTDDSYTKKVKNLKTTAIENITNYYTASEVLYNASLRSPDVDWCVYRSGSPWEKFEIGDTRIMPVYFSTSTSVEFTSMWKSDVNVLFKILAPSETRLMLIETVFNEEKDDIDVEGYEFEVTMPPGRLEIIKKQMIVILGESRELITLKLKPFMVEEALEYLRKMHFFKS